MGDETAKRIRELIDELRVNDKKGLQSISDGLKNLKRR
jgi:hypothetical protein